MKVAVPPVTRCFVNAVGGEPVTLPPSEVYLALERGTVEGFTWPYYDGITSFGWQEVSKYVIGHPLYRDGISIKMNLAKWNSLSPELQGIMLESVAAIQAWSRGWISAYQNTQLAGMIKGGMKVIQFSEADAKQWDEVSNKALWAHFKKAMSADDYSRARKLLGHD